MSPLCRGESTVRTFWTYLSVEFKKKMMLSRCPMEKRNLTDDQMTSEDYWKVSGELWDLTCTQNSFYILWFEVNVALSRLDSLIANCQ